MQFAQLAEGYLKISQTTKRLEKTAILAALLKETPDEEMERVMMLLKGRVFPEWDPRQIGVSDKLAIKAIGVASGENEAKIIQAFKKQGDLGEVAQALMGKKKQHTLLAQQDLTVADVFRSVQKLASIEGHGSVDHKLKIISQLLSNATGVEARFIIRILLEDLRVGIAEGTIRDAVVQWAMSLHGDHAELAATDKPEQEAAAAAVERAMDAGKPAEVIAQELKAAERSGQDKTKERTVLWQQAVQDAIDRSNDIAKVALTAKRDGLTGLQAVQLTIGVPVRVMLAQKALDISEGFDRVGRPAALEYKYDGFRMQVHRKGDVITLFTRRLENVTAQFPDVVAIAKEVLAEDCILDAEAVGYDAKSGKYTAFQQISQRIRRKYDIDALSRELPVELNVFDILHYHNESVYTLPFATRRAIIEKIIPIKPKLIRPSTILVTGNDAEAEVFYKASLAAGNEGIMFKTLDAAYKPGSRVGFMVKVKPVLDALDVVIVGAEWGEGKRSGWLTSFIIACQDEDGNFVELGRVGTGLKELAQEGGTTFEELTGMLRDNILSESGKEVRIKPSVVIEVKFEEIQRSPSYSSGFALRFPRFVQIRVDRRPEEISTLSDVLDAFEAQRGRNK